MSAPLPTFAFLDALAPSLRRANLEACAKLVARDIEYWSAEVIVWKRRADLWGGEMLWHAENELADGKIERRNALARRRRLWALADVFNVDIGQPRKQGVMSLKLVELLQAARERYGADQAEAA